MSRGCEVDGLYRWDGVWAIVYEISWDAVWTQRLVGKQDSRLERTDQLNANCIIHL